MRTLIILTALLIYFIECAGQQTDTARTASLSRQEEANRNVMLNAASSSKPRDISIGLPASAGGTGIFEDGLPVGQYHWPIMPYWHWAGGNSYSSQKLMKVGENAISSGNLGYAINSYTRLGEEELNGRISFTSNQFGLLKADGNLNGPLGKGYFFTAGVFANYDPTSVKTPSVPFIERTQIYKTGITKRWNGNKDEVSILYKLSKNSNLLHGYNFAPFYYVGDGSVKQYEGFRMGLDSYMPEDDEVSYLDMETGKVLSGKIKKMSDKLVHDMLFSFGHEFDNGMKLKVNTRLGFAPNARNGVAKTGGVDNATSASGLSYLNGNPFTGYYQRRLTLFFDTDSRDFMTTAQLTGNKAKNEYRIGLNAWFNYQHVRGSTAVFAHEIKKNPERLLLNGKSSWSYNELGEYYEGTENKIALFATNDWTPSGKLNVYYGIRLEYDRVNVNSLFNAENQTGNSRHDNFSMADPQVTVNNYTRGWFNPVAMANVSYKLVRGLSVVGDYLFIRQRVRLDNFCCASLPGGEPIDTWLGRAGLNLDNDWLQLTSVVSVIRNFNNKQTMHFTKSIGGASETQAKTIAYSIATLGWTTDMVLKPVDFFSLHLLATVQDPRYKNFDVTFRYSDGSAERIDYSNKYVSGISKVLLEIDPSFEFWKMRLWTSFRYYSRQYANKLNNVYFNGHWETFAGLQFKASDKITARLNIVNLLNQSGASGAIPVADLISDPSLLNNYLISGTYIRPFTLEFGIDMKF